MLHTTKHIRLILGAVVILAIAAGQAYAARVAWNVDIHQNKFGYPGDPVTPDYANDFHVWGVLESMFNPPTIDGQVNFQTTGPAGFPPFAPIVPGLGFENFVPTVSQPAITPRPLPPGAPAPGGPFYYFEGSWSTAGQIPYCTWMHFGVDITEDGCNYGYWLQAVWTRDGVDPVANPIYGFYVDDAVGQQKIRVQNASGTQTEVMSMDVMRLTEEEVNMFPLADLNTSFFDTHPEWNSRWAHITTGLPSQFGGPGIDSFFDVFLEVPLGGPLLPGQGLIARQHSSYFEPTGDPDFWQYEIHGAPIPEPASLAGVLLGVGLLIRRRHG